MGRGNVCTHYECEGLYYLDKDLLDVYVHVDDPGEEPKTARQLHDANIKYNYSGEGCDWKYSHAESDYNWREMITTMQDRIGGRFSSFYPADEWRNNETRVILENGLFQVAVVDNEWSAAICLLERTDVDDTGANRTFMRRHCDTYLEAIKQTLIDGWGEAIGYGGAWVSGQKYTRETPSARPVSKRKPSMLGKLEDNKQRVGRNKEAKANKPATKKCGSYEHI